MTSTLIDQFTTFLKLNPDIKFSDQSQKQYIVKLAETYLLNSDVKDQDLEEYIKEVYSQQAISSKLINKLKNLKQLQQKINAEKTVQKVPAEKTSVQKNVQNSKHPKTQEKTQKPVKKVEQKTQKKQQKSGKIFDRIQQGQTGKKKVKAQQPKKQPKSDVDPQVKEQQGAQKKTGGLKHELQVSGKQKCRFYPYCRNIETGNCQYYHPTQKCTFFPHCRYGDNCLYIHETCKFKQACKKPSCPYAHPFKRNSNDLTAVLQALVKTQNPLKPKKLKPKKDKTEQ